METEPMRIVGPEGAPPSDEASVSVPGTASGGATFAFSRRHGVLYREALEGAPQLLCRRGADMAAAHELQRVAGRACALEIVDDETFDRYLQESHEADGVGAISAIEDLGEEIAPDFQRLVDELGEPEDLLEAAGDAPVIRLLNALFTEAVRADASDLHVEPDQGRLRVRMRVDGELKEIFAARQALGPLLLSRIKVMARLDIAEKRLPQDGRISLRLGRRMVDVRVSTMPSGKAERAVLRLLDKQAGRLDLEQLGMPSAVLGRMAQLIARPYGIVLVTGPTGSGKTTTLYAALTRLNDRRRNIMTVEDPVEYELDGISQTQVNARIGMTFAGGLRAILRQDPDVVMIGEIRDLETSTIAVQASLTGHLVFSTLHTNTAIGAITRLRDMGVEPFLLASSLNGVLAQRLVRILCPNCKAPYAPDAAQCARVGVEADAVLYRAKGCPECGGRGYRGRTGVYELITLDDELRRLIHDGESEQRMLAHARRSAPSLEQAGMDLVAAGVTSLEEVLRIAGSD